MLVAPSRKRSRSVPSHASPPCEVKHVKDLLAPEAEISPTSSQTKRSTRIANRISTQASRTPFNDSACRLGRRTTLAQRPVEKGFSRSVEHAQNKITVHTTVLSVQSSPITTAQATPSSRTAGVTTDAEDMSRRCCPGSAPASLAYSRGAPKSPIGQPNRAFLVGDIVWAHLSGHPWWPAMVAYEPNSGVFTDTSKRRWHVQFFGQDALRAWVTSSSMVPFENADQFASLPKRSPTSVSQRHLASWTLGVTDAARALGMNKQQRRQCFTFKYKLTQPAKVETIEQEGSLRKRPRHEDSTDGMSPLDSDSCPPKRLKPNSGLEALLVNGAEKCTVATGKLDEPIPLETPPVSETASVDMDASAPSQPISSPAAHKPAPRRLLTEVVCAICDEEREDEKVSMCKSCGDIYHLDCLGVAQLPEDFCCDECTVGVKACFICKSDDGELKACAAGGCKKSFHFDCVASFPFRRQGHQGVICPLHNCETCSYLGNSRRGKLVRCSRCPVVFHASDCCLPSGYQQGNGRTIICPRHSRSQKMHPNMSWCFDCGGGGKLVCCDRCPAAFHQHCLPSNDPERQNLSRDSDLPSPVSQTDDTEESACSDTNTSCLVPKASTRHSSSWLCPDCRHGRWLHPGNLVWCKLGTYRWWPAKIVSVEEAPPRVAKRVPKVGEFIVRFFGTHDFSFVTHGNVFSFNRRDNPAFGYGTSMDKHFRNAVREAREELALMEAKEWERQKHQRAPYYAIAKNHYNLLTPQERRSASSHPHAHCCGCTAEMACGDNDCDNRSQYFECSSRTCPNGENCRNQRFQKRQYVPVKVVHVGKRGWGLKSTAKIKKDDFVIEYVGEVLTNKMFEERLAQKEDVQRLCYALKLEEKFVVDAGCKGNLARFVNHSCSPNLVAQKWIVNQQTRVGLFALHDIEPDTELTFDYKWADSRMSNMECFCGAPNCSGVVGLSTQAKAAPVPKQKKKKLKKVKKIAKVSEELCFECGEGGVLLICDKKSCCKVYHLACLHLDKPPTGGWWCPWHVCDVCGLASKHFCSLCSTSYCQRHVGTNLQDIDSGLRLCSHHE